MLIYEPRADVLIVRGQSRTQAIRGWPGPPTDNPPHAKSPAMHCKDRILDSIILLIRISYLPVCAIHEFSLDQKKTYRALHMHLAGCFRGYACI